MENEKNKSLTKLQKAIIYFFFYAFLGWVCEELYALLYAHSFIKRGFLFGPICPIYGYAALILIVFFKDYKDKPIKLFLLSATVFTVFEYITDFFLQALFGFRWWDYSTHFLNLNGRVTLSFSIMWGFAGLIFIKYLHPLAKKLLGKILSKIPFKFTDILVHLIAIVFCVDTILSSLHYLSIPNFLFF